MSFDDWRYEDGRRGITWSVVMLAWRIVALLASLVVFALVLWGGAVWLWETFVAPNVGR